VQFSSLRVTRQSASAIALMAAWKPEGIFDLALVAGAEVVSPAAWRDWLGRR
jgi:hypothetical protein